MSYIRPIQKWFYIMPIQNWYYIGLLRNDILYNIIRPLYAFFFILDLFRTGFVINYWSLPPFIDNPGIEKEESRNFLPIAVDVHWNIDYAGYAVVQN